jgi:hypothetical protein
MKKIILCLSLVVLLGAGMAASPAAAAEITLFDWAFNLNGLVYIQGDTLPGALNVSGFDFGTGLGTLTWTTNKGGANNLIAFFDHEIDEKINTFFNEYGATTGAAATGQSWQIDDPFNGSIYANALAGTLNNGNSVPNSDPNDVSMAIGWDFALAAGETATISLSLSKAAPGDGFFLQQTDPDSGANIFFSSSLVINAVPVPGAVYLMGSGLGLLLGFGRKKLLRGPNLR